MHSINPSLDQPIERAARVVALGLLESATRARARVGDATDADALHHFRVTLRRLRTWLRTLEPWLADSTPKKASRRLRKAASLTSDSRDAEVHLAWLQDQRSALSARQRHGWAWLVQRIEEDKEKSDEVAFTKGMRAFDRAAADLSAQLPYYRAHVDPHAADAPRAFAIVLAELILDRGAALAERLNGITSFEDAKAIHSARIAGKRLRYIVEPVAGQVEGASRLVADLAELQDALGGCHDAYVFSAAIIAASEALPAAPTHSVNGRTALGKRPSERHRDLRLGLLALAGRLQERGEQSFRDVKERWLTSPTIAGETERVSQALAASVGESSPTAIPAITLEDGPVAKERKKELDEQHGGNGRSDAAGKRTHHPHQRRAPIQPVRSAEEPAVSQSPGT
jgi:CHAD domain-containing protein